MSLAYLEYVNDIKYALTNVRTMGYYLKINGLYVADLNSF